jgi:hypothetical protein
MSLLDFFRRRPKEESWTIIPMDREEQKVLDELRRRRAAAKEQK